MSDQLALQTRARKKNRNDDYLGLFPDRVFPTGAIDVLERGGNLLFIKSYNSSQKITAAQHRIWTTMSKGYGEVDGSPGHITVVCVWGTTKNTRDVVVFDHRGESNPKRMTIDQWREWLFLWWRDSETVR